MDKVLVIGCNEITDVIVPILAGSGSPVKELCVAGKDKSQSDVYRKYATTGRTRIVSAAVDLSNEERTMMMLQIFGPQMIVYLGDADSSLTAMKCALKVHAAYIDVNLAYNDIKDDFVAKQFELFSSYRDAGLTAITGCSFNHAALISLVKEALDYEYDLIDSIDILEAVSDSGNASSGSNLMDEIRKLSQLANVIEDGEVKQYAPFECKTSREIDGIGHTDLFMFNHDIVNGFFKEMPEVPSVRFFSTFNTKNLNLIKALKNVGMLETDLINANGAFISPLDFLGLVLAKNSVASDETSGDISDNTDISDNSEVVNLVISGRKSGKEKISCYSLDFVDNFDTNACLKDYITGLVVATSVRFVMNGAWSKAGVYAPSRFDNRAFVESLKQDGMLIRIQETEALRLIGDNEVVSKLGNHSSAIDSDDNSEVKVG